MYEGLRTSVRTNGGDTPDFPITIGIHEGLALSPYIFTLVMDVLTRHIHDDIPWGMLFVDDVILIDESREGWRREKSDYYDTARPSGGTELIKKQQEHKIKVEEMRMLRWMSGLTLKDKVRNETKRSDLNVAPIDEKIREGRLRWFGHVRRRPREAPVRKGEDIDIGTERRRRGRPRLM
ncbi:uncharacterized protein [Rutidosis leptorrhynchoides]|uniref:uncharacterized protein n=1 Tax=Rutidosis leptorrhynchoides TaxID=125765 RepID=UPI003A98FCB6